MQDIDPKFFATLNRFDTPTVCNVIELFDVRPRDNGFLDPSIRSIYPKLPPISGYATTATFRSGGPAPEGGGYASLPDQVEKFLGEVSAPRIVVFQDLDSPVVGATYGEVMCTLYKSFGCVGLVTSGASRDIEQVEKLGFPCFSSSIVSSHAYCRIEEVNVPVTIGGVTIRPGDVLHADANGVSTIPNKLVPAVALGCQPLVDAENELMNYILSGKATVPGLHDGYAALRDACLEIPGKIRQQLEA